MDIEEIEKALRLPLPGKKGQHLMAPGYRPDYTADEIAKFNPRIGGVLLLLHPAADSLGIVFTLRKKYPGTHSGQMSFPGGRQEPTDKDLIQTALRETHEEIGIPPSHIKVIGSLSQLYIPPSNFLIYPAVGVLTGPVTFEKQESEVEEIVVIPLPFFLDAASRSTTTIKMPGNTLVEVPAFVYGKYTIWGATAIVLSEFLYMLSEEKKYFPV